MPNTNDLSTMSDEDFNNFDVDALFAEDEEGTEEAAEAPQTSSEDSTTQTDAKVPEDTENTPEESSDGSTIENKDEEETPVEIDADMAAVLQEPLKFKGSDVKINTPEELRTLLQAGLGANRRMQELAPQLKLIRMLEANDLLDPTKLNFLIDVNKGDSEAIKKLVADSKVDPLDITDEVNYVPNDYQISDKQIQVEEVSREIEGMASKEAIVSTFSALDDGSKQVLQNDPTLMRAVAQHHESGTYNEIMNIVAQEQAFGRLTELNPMQAYKTVVEVLARTPASNSGMNEAGTNATNALQNNPNQVPPNDPQGTANLGQTGSSTNSVHSSQTGTQAARAASNASTNTGSTVTQGASIDIADLSDDEFDAFDINSLY